MNALRVIARGSVEAESGPRPTDLTVTLGAASNLPAAAAELVGPQAMALATVVATDELAMPDRDLKVRFVFEPTAPGAADQFVTLLVSVEAASAQLPSLAIAVPAANWHEREMQDLFGIAAIAHPDPRPLVVHDGWPAGAFPLRKAFDGSRRPPVEPADEFP